MIAGTLYCCECNLCSLFACPEDLDPKNVCVQGKPVAREKRLFLTGNAEVVTPHPHGRLRRIPMRRLNSKAGPRRVPRRRPAQRAHVRTRRVTLPLKQHAGAPAAAVVRTGDQVARAICSRRRRRSWARASTPASTAWCGTAVIESDRRLIEANEGANLVADINSIGLMELSSVAIGYLVAGRDVEGRLVEC